MEVATTMKKNNDEDLSSRLNEEAYATVCKKLRRKLGATVEEMADAADVDHRTVYRYLRRLQDDEGEIVIRRGSGRPIRYEILPA